MSLSQLNVDTMTESEFVQHVKNQIERAEQEIANFLCDPELTSEQFNKLLLIVIAVFKLKNLVPLLESEFAKT
jgi:hypothetical protein